MSTQPELSVLSDEQKRQTTKWAQRAMGGMIVSLVLGGCGLAYALIADKPDFRIVIGLVFGTSIAARFWRSYCERRIRRIENPG